MYNKCKDTYAYIGDFRRNKNQVNITEEMCNLPSHFVSFYFREYFQRFFFFF